MMDNIEISEETHFKPAFALNQLLTAHLLHNLHFSLDVVYSCAIETEKTEQHSSIFFLPHNVFCHS